MTTENVFEQFLSPATRIDAEKQLIAMGAEAVPILTSLLTGEARNGLGVQYRSLGMPLRCALEVAIRLGPIAKPLESQLRAELKRGDVSAAVALGSLIQLDEASIVELAATLGDSNWDLSMESAMALLKCGAVQHPAVVAATTESEKAKYSMARAKMVATSRRDP